MMDGQTAFTLFLSLFSLSFPFLLLGVIVSSYLLVFVDERQLAAKFPKNRVFGAIAGSFLGMLFPVAQYGNIPVTRRLIIQGVPVAVAISFFVASGTLNPLTIWISWQVFPDNPALIAYRLVLTAVMAIILGVLFSFSNAKFLTDLPTGSRLQQAPSPSSSLQVFLENIGREVLELGGWLLIGCLMAAVFQTFLPQSQLLSDPNSRLQIPIMMGLGFVLALGSPFNISFLLPLTAKVLPGSLLAFLLFSSVVDIKQTLLMISAFRPKVVIYLLILIFQLSFLFALVINFYGG
jgi:uncharacterized membrane protein YraQ (UPF0718 family)